MKPARNCTDCSGHDTGISEYLADLHVHSVLSPCADVEMGASDIVEKCRSEGISIIAVTDHNHVANFRALRDAAVGPGNPLLVLPGMEAQSMEDIHVVVIFPDEDTAYKYKDWLWQKMPDIKNRENKFGYQLIIDKENNVLAQEDILLIQGAMMSVDEISSEALKMGCIVIMAHMDRPSFSYEAVLGPLPDEFQCSAIELSSQVKEGEIPEWAAKYPGRTFIRSSDAHKLDRISRSVCTRMKLGGLSFEEVRLALRRENGREVLFA
ncbi:MAG: PHP domain-containing protein [Synergistaceae bacterium]|nr:PHP domain-containing protein [Synergistaceae bacterium]